MAIQYPSFRADPNAVPQISGWPQVIKSFQQGYQLSQMPEQMRQQKASDAAKLQYLRAQTEAQDLNNQYYVPNIESQIALRNAQAQQVTNPEDKFTGDIGNAYNLEKLRQAAAQDPSKMPYYLAAKKAADSQQALQNSLINYRSVLTDTADKRYSTNLGKTQQELDDINNGFMPGTGRKVALTPDQKKELADEYGLDIAKKTTDVQTRSRNTFGAQLEQTFSMLNPDDLTQYSGLEGAAKYKKDTALSAIGKAPQNYINYNNEVTKATALAKQYRQYLQDSKAVYNQDALANLANPSTWYKDPKVAIAQLKTFQNIINKETAITGAATQNKDVYTGKYKPTGNEVVAPKVNPSLSHLSDEELEKIAGGGQ